MYNDGQTPYLSEMTIDKQDAKITGTALLDQSGRYAATLDPQETLLLNMLMEKAGPAVSLTLQLPSETTGVPPERSWISLLTERISVRIQSAYDGGRFRFKVRVRLTASVMEKLSRVNLDAGQAKVEAACAEALRDRLEELIGKLQKYKVDPVGFGNYARAFENGAFEKAKADWGKSFGEADVSLRIDVSLADEGSVK